MKEREVILTQLLLSFLRIVFIVKRFFMHFIFFRPAMRELARE